MLWVSTSLATATSAMSTDTVAATGRLGARPSAITINPKAATTTSQAIPSRRPGATAAIRIPPAIPPAARDACRTPRLAASRPRRPIAISGSAVRNENPNTSTAAVTSTRTRRVRFETSSRPNSTSPARTEGRSLPGKDGRPRCRPSASNASTCIEARPR